MDGRIRLRAVTLTILIMIVGLTASACGRDTMAFVSEGRSYELDATEDLHVSVERPPTEGRPVSESSALRRDALV